MARPDQTKRSPVTDTNLHDEGIGNGLPLRDEDIDLAQLGDDHFGLKMDQFKGFGSPSPFC